MIDFFDKLRFWGDKRSPLLNKFHFYGVVNRLVAIVANLVLPIYFAVTKRAAKNRLVGGGELRTSTTGNYLPNLISEAYSNIASCNRIIAKTERKTG